MLKRIIQKRISLCNGNLQVIFCKTMLYTFQISYLSNLTPRRETPSYDQKKYSVTNHTLSRGPKLRFSVLVPKILGINIVGQSQGS